MFNIFVSLPKLAPSIFRWGQSPALDLPHTTVGQTSASLFALSKGRGGGGGRECRVKETKLQCMYRHLE